MVMLLLFYFTIVLLHPLSRSCASGDAEGAAALMLAMLLLLCFVCYIGFKGMLGPGSDSGDATWAWSRLVSNTLCV